MSKTFDSIIRGLEEIKAYKEGKTQLRSTVIEIEQPPHCDAEIVKSLRAELRLSQSAFAKVLGVSKKTIEAWEAGRNVPSGSACRLLEVIAKDKGILERERIVVVS